MSTKLCEWYDADTAQAVLQGTKLKGNYVIDPETGELGNDLAPYAQPVEGYGRVWNQTCFQNLSGPRVYMLNLWNELLTAIINPLGTSTPEVPSLGDIVDGKATVTSVCRSYYICIDPSKFGPLANVKAKSDRFAEAIEKDPDYALAYVGLADSRAEAWFDASDATVAARAARINAVSSSVRRESAKRIRLSASTSSPGVGSGTISKRGSPVSTRSPSGSGAT